MSPIDMNRAQRAELQREIDQNRRWELRLPIYAVVALVVLAAIVVVRVVFFS
jgi:negative regulator of sigma E activity